MAASSPARGGDLNGALAEYNRALQINPGYEVAQQEINQIQKEMQSPPGSAPPQAELPHSQATADVPPERGPSPASVPSPAPSNSNSLSNDPIPAIHMVEDVKVIYQAIGAKAAGF